MIQEENIHAPHAANHDSMTKSLEKWNCVSTTDTHGIKPSDGFTDNQPFPRGTGGSTNFRIPALVTLTDGTLVAAADARWNTVADAGGLDTIVSYSTNQGATWHYTFANYLGDNGNQYNPASTTFIDPALVTDGKTVYMMVDLHAGGVALNSSNALPSAGTGFDSNNRLELKKNGESTYQYYLKEGKIYKKDGTALNDYLVDEYYNLYQNHAFIGNIFYSNAAYQVFPTCYLYLTKSTDGGKTWSVPTLLNNQVKQSDECFYGVGPGRGLITSTGRILFPCYTYPNHYTSVIYSDDNAVTWKRSANMSHESSEAALVEANSTIYMFTRFGGYYTSNDYGSTWSQRKEVNIPYTTSCQLSAITYSRAIDGKTAILLSAPTINRSHGKIFVILVNEDGSLNWKYTYSINDGIYQYSCLTELNDGSIGLLYENADAAIIYQNYAMEVVALGAEISNDKRRIGG